MSHKTPENLSERKNEPSRGMLDDASDKNLTTFWSILPDVVKMDRKLTYFEKQVYGHVARNTSKASGFCYDSDKTISSSLHGGVFDHFFVRRVLASLRDQGYIEILNGNHGEGRVINLKPKLDLPIIHLD